MIVICQQWEESEREWGTRPDGISIHKSLADHASFITEYWNKMPAKAPDEYSRPIRIPDAIVLKGDSKYIKQLGESSFGIRLNISVEALQKD